MSKCSWRTRRYLEIERFMMIVTMHGMDFHTANVPRETVDRLVAQAIERRCYHKDEEKALELTRKFFEAYEKPWNFRDGSSEHTYDTYDALAELRSITLQEARELVKNEAERLTKAKGQKITVQKVLSALRTKPEIAQLLRENTVSEDLDVSF